MRSEASTAVDAMVAASKAGARSKDVAEAGFSKLSAASKETAAGYGLGGGIGLALNDWPAITPTSEDRLPDGAVLSLRTFGRDGDNVSFANAIVQVGPNGATRLSPL
jgi:Xaa-Pro aminopeptidase